MTDTGARCCEYAFNLAPLDMPSPPPPGSCDPGKSDSGPEAAGPPGSAHALMSGGSWPCTCMAKHITGRPTPEAMRRLNPGRAEVTHFLFLALSQFRGKLCRASTGNGCGNQHVHDMPHKAPAAADAAEWGGLTRATKRVTSRHAA